MNEQAKHTSLDPSDWTAMRALAHRAVDEAIDHLATRARATGVATDPRRRSRNSGAAAARTAGRRAGLRGLQRWVMPYPMGNTHPRFWGWYMGAGTPFGALGDFLASMLNPNMGGGDHGANYVETQVVDWCKDIVGLPRDAGGLLVSGGSMANLVGLAVARNATRRHRRARGRRAVPAARTTFYASTEVHSCAQKSLELLGLGARALRKVAGRRVTTVSTCARSSG